jgi:putative copper export protein
MFWAGARARLRLDRRMRVSAPTAKAKAARLVKIHHSIGYFL